MTSDRLAILRAWAGAQASRLQLRTPEDVLRRQERMWRRFSPTLSRTPALAGLAGLPHHRLPVSTPDEVRRDFARWNTVDVSLERAVAAAEAAERGGEGGLPHGLEAGFSTGTGGARGLFLVSAAERAGYLGHALARLAPAGALLGPCRIALCLRADSALYRDVTGAGSIAFTFLGLDLPTGEKLARLNAFRPHVLIAPSHVLADISRHGCESAGWPLRRLFYGAEPMPESERAWIGRRLGMRPDPIYQATEGFIGAPCRFGTLHLNEDVMIVEREAVAGTNRFQPVVTDLRRTSQPVVRLKLDDLLESAPPCRCGSPLHAIRGVEGRIGDLWRYPGRVLAPRMVEEALATAVGPETEWRATASPSAILIEVAPDRAEAAKLALGGLFAGAPAPPVTTAPAPLRDGPKRRRVRWESGR
ncbi:cell division protein FtsA [Brevundimonas sp.]|uniref:cell division protein FtsA n=1 Tax=Brevundimonas sp. TaxID=1871086 RepID=UPI002FC61B52